MNVARICSELVKIRSENPPGHTREVTEYLSPIVESLGLKISVVSRSPDKCNLLGGRCKAPLLLCGHLDVVPAHPDGWSHQPFSGDYDGTYIWGRGSTDMKGGCAALLTSVYEYANTHETPDVQLAFVCDEENGGPDGIQFLLAKNLICRPSDCLIAEPTPRLSPCVGQKGLCRLQLDFLGESGHGSLYPHEGRSAVMDAMDLLMHLRKLNERVFNPPENLESLYSASAQVLTEIFDMKGTDQLLRKITFNPGKIEGGEESNIIARHCMLDLDMRLPWGCEPEDLIGGIRRHTPFASITPVSVSSPTLTPPDSFLVDAVCRGITSEYREKTVPIIQWAASDARFLRQQGLSAIEYGPGDITRLHAIDERVDEKNLFSASRVYSKVIESYMEKEQRAEMK